MALAPAVVTYITNAFPNAVQFIGPIMSKYATQLTLCAAYGLSAVWEYVYDRLHDQDPTRIEFLSASEIVSEASSSSTIGPSMPNGYSDADKKALDQILQNATKVGKKGSTHFYQKRGTYEEAKQDLENLSGSMEDKGSEVFVKNLPHQKTAIVRETCTHKDAKATLEIQKPNTKGAPISIIKIRYV